MLRTTVLVFMLALAPACAQASEPFDAPVATGALDNLGPLKNEFHSSRAAELRSIEQAAMGHSGILLATFVNRAANVTVTVNLKRPCAPEAVAKFEALLELGVPREHMRLVEGRVKNAPPDTTHLVAAIFIDDRWFIMDNGAIVTGHRIVPVDELRGFTPLWIYQ